MRVSQTDSSRTSTPDGTPLDGLRVVELGGIGPTPHAGMWFAMLGAEVVRIERRGTGDAASDLLMWGRTLVRADLKSPGDREEVLRLIEKADVLIEGFRPGVAERLGLGPEDCQEVNPGLVYGRMTGWGQSGPYAHAAGHDINYIGLTGALHAIGGDAPVPPLNLVGDFGGGSMFLIAGVLAALWERRVSGRGQVVDAAIVDGTSVLMQLIWSERAVGRWQDARHSNLLDGAAPFYRCYECADGGYMAVGAIESQFYERFIERLGLGSANLPDRHDREHWPDTSARIVEVFRSHPRKHWEDVFAGTDACVTPVLRLDEVATNAHMAHRGAVVTDGDKTRAAAAPGFDRSTVPPLGPPRDTALVGLAARWQAS